MMMRLMNGISAGDSLGDGHVRLIVGIFRAFGGSTSLDLVQPRPTSSICFSMSAGSV